MFSFCLYDKKNESIIIARDYFGIKPIVYTTIQNSLYFSSEVKAFYAIPEWKPRPDMNAWHSFLNIRFPPSPFTLFKDVKKVQPGCFIYLCKNPAVNNISKNHTKVTEIDLGEWNGGIYRYYSLPDEETDISFGEAGKHLYTLLSRSVKKQLIADVDTGIFLSGGIDSSTLTTLASKFKHNNLSSLCFGFNELSDENRDAGLIAEQFNTIHRDIYINDKPLSHFSKTIYYMEEPKVNCLQGFLISKEARKFQKVMISGLGGDELFGGYDIYTVAQYLDIINNTFIRPGVHYSALLIRMILSLFPFLCVDNFRRGADILKNIAHPLDMYLLLRNSWDHDRLLIKSIYKRDILRNEASPVRNNFIHSFQIKKTITQSFMNFELGNKMVDDFLTNEDRMSMAHGLEIRVPFLDKDIVEFVHSLPLSYKIRMGNRKIILRHLMKNKIPQEILRKGKQGFTFNPVCQIKKDLGSFAVKYLTRERVEESGLFNYRYINQIINSYPRGSLRWHYFLLWKIIGYHIWEDIFIKGGGAFE
jgi:asparagine synthase (glutamine-hydrolysing)